MTDGGRVFGNIGVVICVPDRQVRVRAGGERPLGISHPWPITLQLGIWAGPAEATPWGCKLLAHILEADPAGP